MEENKKARTRRKRRGITALLLFAFSMLLLFFAQVSSGFAEWYSRNVYVAMVNLIGRFFDMFMVSAAEIMLYILLVFCILSLVRFLYRLLYKREGKEAFLNGSSKAALGASILFLVYTLLCGLNYQRISFSELNQMETRAYSIDELLILCVNLTNEVNHTGNEVSRDENGLALAGKSAEATQAEAAHAMRKLGTQYKDLGGYYPYPKKLLVPEILSYQNLSGIYAPFTIEANYNNAMVPYNIPFTMCHELSHLRGFMQEEEANFIAYLACVQSGNPAFAYSGNLMAWIYSTNLLQDVAPEEYQALRENLSMEVQMDLEANSFFWEQYDGAAADIADKVNDTYLKANGQSDGVKSYDRMVDLLIWETFDKK